MKRNIWVTIMAGLVLGQALLLSAGFARASAQNPTKEEADAYKAYYDANAAKDHAKAYQAAKAYLEKFPAGTYAKYLKDKGLPQARGHLFNQAMNSKNTAEMIQLGKEALAENPENLDYLYLLSFSIRQNELSASPANFSHAAEAAEFTRQTIRLIEAGKVPAVVPQDKWNQNAILSRLYQTLAIIDASNKNQDQALGNFKKASELDPSDHYNYYVCGSLYQTKYLAAVQKFQAFPETDRQDPEAKPEVKAALDDVNKNADLVIDCWARFMALTAASNPYGGKRDEIERVLTELYKYRHPDAPDGLQKLIDQHKPATGGNS